MGFHNVELGIHLDLSDAEWVRLVCKDILDHQGNSVKERFVSLNSEEFNSTLEEGNAYTFQLYPDLKMDSSNTEFTVASYDEFFDVTCNCQFQRPGSDIYVKFDCWEFSGISIGSAGEGQKTTVKKTTVDTLYEWLDHLMETGRVKRGNYDMTLLGNFGS